VTYNQQYRRDFTNLFRDVLQLWCQQLYYLDMHTFTDSAIGKFGDKYKKFYFLWVLVGLSNPHILTSVNVQVFRIRGFIWIAFHKMYRVKRRYIYTYLSFTPLSRGFIRLELKLLVVCYFGNCRFTFTDKTWISGVVQQMKRKYIFLFTGRSTNNQQVYQPVFIHRS